MVTWELISHSFQSSNRILQLRSNGARLNWRPAGNLGMHSLRRGAAWAIMPASGTFAQLLRAGQWRGNAMRVLRGPSEGEGRAMADILIGGSEDEPLELLFSLSFHGIARRHSASYVRSKRSLFWGLATSGSKYIQIFSAARALGATIMDLFPFGNSALSAALSWFSVARS